MLEGLKSGNVAETCRKYEIAPNLYYRWKDEVEAGAKTALGGRSAAAQPDAEQEKRIKQLERALGPELQSALQPLLEEIESLSERIRECNERVQQIAQESYPEVARLEQVKGVGTLIALTYVPTLEDPRRFGKSRDVGCYLGLRPGRRNSGQSEPQLHISKEGDPYLRTMMVQSAHHIPGLFGADSDLRRWGLRLAERGGKNAKKRAVVAVARKLAILLHRLWVSGEAYEPLRNQRVLTAAA